MLVNLFGNMVINVSVKYLIVASKLNQFFQPVPTIINFNFRPFFIPNPFTVEVFLIVEFDLFGNSICDGFLFDLIRDLNMLTDQVNLFFIDYILILGIRVHLKAIFHGPIQLTGFVFARTDLKLILSLHFRNLIEVFKSFDQGFFYVLLQFERTLSFELYFLVLCEISLEALTWSTNDQMTHYLRIIWLVFFSFKVFVYPCHIL
jgi:hypothetical protein